MCGWYYEQTDWEQASGQAWVEEAAVCAGRPVHYERTDRDRVARPGRRMQYVCTGEPVYCEQTFRA